MKFLSICLVLLLGLAYSTSLYDKYPMNFGAKRSIMTLLTQVEARMKTGGPLDAIQKMLDDFVATVTEEQIQHDQLHASQQQECTEEFTFREREVQDATAAFKEASESLDGCQSQNVRATGDLAITKRQLSENKNYLQLVLETRRRDATSFETSTEVYQKVTAALDQALVILEEIWSGQASFAQLTKHTNGLLKSSVKIRKAHLLAPLMSALAQLATQDIQSDEALLERVKSMLQNYRTQVQEEYQNAAASEQAAVEAYNQDKARLDATISHLEEQELSLEFEITELEKCIINQTGIVQTAGAKRDRNQKLWDDATALCQAVEDEYASASQARREELELLSAIRERVEARFANLSEGVKARGVQDEFSYDNTYAYDNAKFAPK